MARHGADFGDLLTAVAQFEELDRFGGLSFVLGEVDAHGLRAGVTECTGWYFHNLVNHARIAHPLSPLLVGRPGRFFPVFDDDHPHLAGLVHRHLGGKHSVPVLLDRYDLVKRGQPRFHFVVIFDDRALHRLAKRHVVHADIQMGRDVRDERIPAFHVVGLRQREHGVHNAHTRQTVFKLNSVHIVVLNVNAEGVFEVLLRVQWKPERGTEFVPECGRRVDTQFADVIRFEQLAAHPHYGTLREVLPQFFARTTVATVLGVEILPRVPHDINLRKDVVVLCECVAFLEQLLHHNRFLAVDKLLVGDELLGQRVSRQQLPDLVDRTVANRFGHQFGCVIGQIPNIEFANPVRHIFRFFFVVAVLLAVGKVEVSGGRYFGCQVAQKQTVHDVIHRILPSHSSAPQEVVPPVQVVHKQCFELLLFLRPEVLFGTTRVHYFMTLLVFHKRRMLLLLLLVRKRVHDRARSLAHSRFQDCFAVSRFKLGLQLVGRHFLQRCLSDLNLL